MSQTTIINTAANIKTKYAGINPQQMIIQWVKDNELGNTISMIDMCRILDAIIK